MMTLTARSRFLFLCLGLVFGLLALRPAVAEDLVPGPMSKSIKGVFEVVVTSMSGDAPQTASRSSGSAVAIAPGYAVTCAHVVSSATAVVLRNTGGTQELPATVVGFDLETDIAVLKFSGEGIPSLKMVDKLPVAGTEVYAVGFPGETGQLITRGVVCATGFSTAGLIPVEDFVITDAVIGPGSSGGALFDGAGRLVGMTSAIRQLAGFSAPLALAIPATLLRDITSQIRQNGFVSPRYLGVRAGSGESEEALIMDVFSGSPAAMAGIEPGDTVLAMDNQPIKCLSQFLTRARSARPDRILNLRLRRHGEEKLLEVKIPKTEGSEETLPFQGYCPNCECYSF